MCLENVADKVLQTEVLIIGGGLAGCVAAIKASEYGADVTILEKSSLERGGSAASGMDHIATVPNADKSANEIVKGITGDGVYPPILNKKGLTNSNVFFAAWKNTRKNLAEMESWGVTLRWEDGDHYWIPSLRTGGMTTIRFHGQKLKPQLAAAVRKRGIRVLERTMGVDLLTSKGKVVGAIALNVRNNDFHVIKAKVVVVCTGMVQRIFNPEDGAPWKNKMMYHWCPTGAGDAHAMTYRAGGKLVNMEFSSWFSRLVDDKTLMFGSLTDGDGLSTPIVNAKGDVVAPNAFMSLEKYVEQEEKGLSPLYFDVQNNPEDHQRKREISTADERLVTLKYIKDRGWDPRKHRWELHGTKSLALTKNMAGIVTDETFKTTVDGLYAIGDSVQAGGTVLGALNSGMICAENAVKDVRAAEEPVIDETQVRHWKERLNAHMTVQDGAEPLEFETKIRAINERYATLYRSEGKLKEALSRLADVRRDWLHRLAAATPHELMRVVDCYNLADLAEVHLRSALKREDTRASFWRKDFPARNPEWDNKVIFAYSRSGEMVLEKGEFPEVKPEYLKGEG